MLPVKFILLVYTNVYDINQVISFPTGSNSSSIYKGDVFTTPKKIINCYIFIDNISWYEELPKLVEVFLISSAVKSRGNILNKPFPVSVAGVAGIVLNMEWEKYFFFPEVE